MHKFLLLIVGLTMLNTFSSAQPIDVKDFHPRVLIDSSMILTLEGRALANTIEWQQLQTRISAIDGYSSAEIMDVVYEGQHYVFYYTLSFYASGNTVHRDSAVSLFQEYFTNYTVDSAMFYDSGYESRSTLVDVSIMYDWLYAYLPEPFRTNVRTRLILWGNWLLTQPNIYGIWYQPYYDQGNNYTMGHFTGLTHLGFAIHSEDPVNGDKFINVADSIRPFLMDFTNTRLKNGDANEGWGYGAGYAANYFKALAVFKTGTENNLDHFANTTYDEDVIKFLPHATLPNLTHMLPEGDWARESTGELWDYHRIVADLVSSYSNDPTSQQVAAFYGHETVPFSSFAVTAYRWYPFLFSNQEVTQIDYRTLPDYQTNFIYTDTSGTDQFVRRTGWTSSDQWVSYRAGGRYGDHAHNGSGHFSVFQDGWLLIDDNILTSSGIEGYDSMHNCIHIENMNSFEMYPFNDYQNAEHSLGVRREFTTDYSYLWTNSAPIYIARSIVYNNVEINQRQFFYLPELQKILVFDHVETNAASDQKWFGLNYFGTPTVVPASDYSYYSNGTSKAYVHTAYPLNNTMWNYGNSVRVSNTVAQAEDHFVHLVNVSDAAAAPLNVVSLNVENGSVVESSFYGTYHKDALKDYIILFASDDPAYQYDSIAYDIPLTDDVVHHYLIGMNPSTAYYVSGEFVSGKYRYYVSDQPYTNSTMVMSTAGGILSFELTDEVASIIDPASALNYQIWFDTTTDQILIHATNYDGESALAEVYAVNGEKIATSGIAESGSISTTNFSNGIYLVRIIHSDGRSENYKLSVY